jgi:hypothetical protein
MTSTDRSYDLLDAGTVDLPSTERADHSGGNGIMSVAPPSKVDRTEDNRNEHPLLPVFEAAQSFPSMLS